MLLKILQLTMIWTVVEVMGLEVKPGENLTLECVYDPNEYKSGQSILRFWLRDNGTGEAGAVSMNNNILIDSYELNVDDSVGEYNLVISNASLQFHNGTFRCHVEDREETTKTRVISEIPVIVLNKPSSPIISPQSPTVEKDNLVEVNCSTIGGNPWPTIQWLNADKTVVVEETNDSFTSELVVMKNVQDPAKNVYTSVLKIKGRREDHNKVFLCTVRNSAMEENEMLQSKMKLNVHYPAIISITPYGDFSIEEHSNVTFECKIDANPSIYLFFWSRKGDFWHQKRKITMYDVKARDSGKYECYAVNRIGEGTPRNETYMEVLHGPIHNHSSQVKVTEGSQVKINCAVRARPPPSSIMWYKYGNSSFRQNGTELKFKSVSMSDKGFYACESRNMLFLNILGTRYAKEEERVTRTNLSLIVEKPPPPTPLPPCRIVTTAKTSTASLPPFAQLTDIVYEKKSRLLYFLVLGKVPAFVKIDVKYEGESEWELYESYTVLTQQFSLALLPTKYRGPFKNSSNNKVIQNVRIRVCQLSGLFCGKNHHAQIYDENEQDGGSWILYLFWMVLTFIAVVVISFTSFFSCLFAFAYLYRRKLLQLSNTSNPSPENPIPVSIQDENPDEDPDAIHAQTFRPSVQAVPLSQLGLDSIFRFQRPRITSVLV